MTRIMPEGANIEALKVYNDFGESIIIDVPSRSIAEKVYRVTIERASRLMSCECPGFHFRGDCHHIRALLFLFYKRSKKGGMDTRLNAYYDIINNPDKLERSQQRVYESLKKDGPADFGEIARRLNLPDRAHVTGRIDELRKMELVEDGGKHNGRHIWRAIT